MRQRSRARAVSSFRLAGRLRAPVGATAAIALLSTLAACTADTSDSGAEREALDSTEQPVSAAPALKLSLTAVVGGGWYFDAPNVQNAQPDLPGDWAYAPANRRSFGGEGSAIKRTASARSDVPLRVRQTLNGKAQDVFAIFNDGTWTVDSNANQMFDATDAVYFFGFSGNSWSGFEKTFQPVSGNWSSTGIGYFVDGDWYLNISANVTTAVPIGPQEGIRHYKFGSPGDTAVVGDWNGDGRSKIGVFRDGNWYLDWNGDGEYNAGDVSARFGRAGDVPVVGAWTGGKAEQIGVVSTNHWYLDTSGDRAYGAGDVDFLSGPVGVLSYIPFQPAAPQYPFTPVVGAWSTGTSTALQCNGYQEYAVNQVTTNAGDCTKNPSALRAPLELRLRNSATDVKSFDYLAYETEYLTTVEYACTELPGKDECPKGLSLTAGASSKPISVSQAHDVVVSGIGPLRMVEDNPAKTAGEVRQSGTRVLVKTWYAAPTDNTINSWVLGANGQADALTRAQNFYLLAMDYARTTTFNHDQLDALAKIAQARADSATNPIDKKKWQALATSLAQTRDAQPTPVPASQLAQYLADLVSNARADMLLQGARTQDMLAMFDRVQAELEAVAASTSSEIGRLRDARKSTVTTKMTTPIAGLKAALARTTA